MPIKIFTDSGSDIPKHIQAQYGIEVIPLPVLFSDGPLPQESSIEDFYYKLKTFDKLPTTSSPNPSQFLEAYKRAEPGSDLLVICMSANVSSTYQSAIIARDMLLDEGFDGKIEVLDSKTFSGGLSLIVSTAAKWSESCTSLEELTTKLQQLIDDTRAYFTLETLENIIKGGRLNRLAGGVASVLNIKLLLRINEEGTIEVVEKTRGFRKAVNSLIAKLDEKQHDYENAAIAIVHSNNEKLALEVKERILEKHPFHEVYLSCMGPVMGTHAGEGGIGFAF
ncbi:DegV family protein [Paenibacillus herberti]|nr:DegV family protein [Paenibacillus herberti]